MDQECQKVFKELKSYLSSLPLLSKSKMGEELYLYLIVSPSSISSILIREEDRPQWPVYHVSKTLQDAEIRYTWLKKLVFTLIALLRKPHSYFQAYIMVILMDQLLKMALHKPKTSGRVAKWALELSKFNPVFHP